MSFDLRIRFLGLAMFVPQTVTDEEGNETPHRMHVLLPATAHHDHGGAPAAAPPTPGTGAPPPTTPDPHAGHADAGAGTGDAAGDAAGDAGAGVAGAGGAGAADTGAGAAAAAAASADDPHRHFARIVYDTAYETQGAKQLNRQLRFVSIERRQLELLGLSQEKLDLEVPSDVCDITPVAGPLPKSVLGADPGPGMVARLSMDSGALTDCRLGAFFTLNGKLQRMTTRTEWTVRGIAGDSLAPLTLAPLNGGDAGTMPTLYPINQTIQLMVFNAPAAEYPPKGEFHVPQSGMDADHFVHYYGLFGEAAGPIPQAPDDDDIKPIREVGVVPEPGAEVPRKGKETGSTMTCINTTGTLTKP